MQNEGVKIQVPGLRPPLRKSSQAAYRLQWQKERHFLVSLSQFDDNLLLSDYNLLEETKRVAETAERIRSKLCNTTTTSCSHHHFKLPYPLRTLRTVAASRRTKLLFLPSVLSSRETNQTLYNHRKKCISWTIEWGFIQQTLFCLTMGELLVHEDTSLCSLIENHLQPSPWNHPLRRFCEERLDCLKFFIRKYPKGKSPFREFDINAPTRQQLDNTVVIEYPVIHVFLPMEHYDFEVIRENLPVTHRTEGKDSSIADNEIQKAWESNPSQNESEKAFGNLVLSLSTRAGAGNKVQSTSLAKESGVLEDMEFNFKQGLPDTGINLDDFLYLEGEFAKQSETEDRRDLSNTRGVFFAEEGEIVD
ncbi:HIT-type Zinc finger family protein, putative isoform 2 [Hibiscus syriacus]|uniref:HIT-type Zinc finger family protein, putative isoform 2 n=1 Tax=Hibiscus syriacus TaxID=106335 RepID=A0A6A3CE37_HIBSY|nr:HIT-type Zinc finger family protein, putative isoform 2 [Hibiscus syriacus]